MQIFFAKKNELSQCFVSFSDLFCNIANGLLFFHSYMNYWSYQNKLNLFSFLIYFYKYTMKTPWVYHKINVTFLYKISFFSTVTVHRIHVNSMSMLSPYVRKKISMKFSAISTYFYIVISMVERSTSFRRTLLGVISMGKNQYYFDVLF